MTGGLGTAGAATPDSAAGGTAEGAPQPRTVSKLVRVLSTAAIVVVVLVLGLDALGTSPRLCTPCHEMELRAEAWQRSPHAGVPCVTCHTPVRAWYAFPVRLADRVALLARDIAAHRAGGFTDPVDERSAGVPPTGDGTCLQCHDPRRKATSGMRIVIDHVEHAQRNGSCVSCHVRTAHPLETRGAALSFMGQCMSCHGKPTSPKASAACATCHPEGYKLLPASHTTKKWDQGGHGLIAMEDRLLCEMCHSKRMCDGCHGIDMPHPMDWDKTAHATAAGANPGLCIVCHGPADDSPDCLSCHKK